MYCHAAALARVFGWLQVISFSSQYLRHRRTYILNDFSAESASWRHDFTADSQLELLRCWSRRRDFAALLFAYRENWFLGEALSNLVPPHFDRIF
jgi:hypothetical protein